MSLLWDVCQSVRIQQLQTAASSTEGRAKQLAKLLEGVEERIDRLALIARAMWSFMQETHGLTEEDLYERVKTIDLSDGRLDGKVAKKASQCSQCGKVMSARHNKCLYCGAEGLVDTVFDQV